MEANFNLPFGVTLRDICPNDEETKLCDHCQREETITQFHRDFNLELCADCKFELELKAELEQEIIVPNSPNFENSFISFMIRD